MVDADILDSFGSELQVLPRRRALLPWWVKLFIWIFMVAGLLAVPIFILIVTKKNSNYLISLYGLTSKSPFSFLGILLTMVLVFKGIVSFSLWTERNWAVSLAIFDAIMGIIICLFAMLKFQFLGSLPEDSFNFRPEILILILFLLKLINIRSEWHKRKVY